MRMAIVHLHKARRCFNVNWVLRIWGAVETKVKEIMYDILK